MLGAKAQGQFCLVTVNVKNIGKESQMFDGSSQKALRRRRHRVLRRQRRRASTPTRTPSTFLNDINPGNQVTGVVVFDIPKNVKLTKLELHDSPFSGGVDRLPRLIHRSTRGGRHRPPRSSGHIAHRVSSQRRPS